MGETAARSDRLDAVRRLEQEGTPDAVAALVDALQSADALVAEAAAEALGRLGHPRGVEPLCRALLSGNWAAGRALASIRAVSAVPALCRALRHGPHPVAVPVAQALGQIAVVETTPALLPGLSLIRARLAPWSGASAEDRSVYEAAYASLSASVAGLEAVAALPLPAGAAPDGRTLPRPSAGPAPEGGCLPIPADPGAD